MVENNQVIHQSIDESMKVNFFKKHYYGLTILLVSILSIGIVAATAICLFGFQIHVTVLEDQITSSLTSLSISGHRGETIESNISIFNHGNVSQNVCLSYDWVGPGNVSISVSPDEILTEPGEHLYPIQIFIPLNITPGSYTINATVTKGPC